MEILEWIHEALTNFRAYSLLFAVFADVILGVCVALFRSKNFDLKKLGQFYKSMVLPYFLGYVVVYVGLKAFSAGLLKIEWYSEHLDWLVDPGFIEVAWAFLIGTIGISVIENGVALYGGNLVDRVKAKIR